MLVLIDFPLIGSNVLALNTTKADPLKSTNIDGFVVI